jgi:hypothetical protein
MSLSSAVTDLATRIGQEIKAVRAEIVSALAGKASVTHAATHATAGADPVTPGAIGAATSGHTHPAAAPAAHAASHATGGSDALAPAAIGAVPTTRQVTSGTGLSGGGDLTADRALAVAYGSAAGTAVQGNDARVVADQAAGTASIRTLGTGAQQAASGTDSRIVGAQQTSAKGVANGYAGLDAGAKVPIAQLPTGGASGLAQLDAGGLVPQALLPAIALTEFLGAVASQSAMLALAGQRGDWCTRTDLGVDYQLIAEPSSTLASWRAMTYPASPVSSVNGRTGAVTGLLEASDASVTNARTPTAHAGSHGPNGSDAISADYIARALLTAKSMFPVALSAGTIGPQAAPTVDGQVLTASAAAGTGMVWAAPSAATPVAPRTATAGATVSVDGTAAGNMSLTCTADTVITPTGTPTYDRTLMIECLASGAARTPTVAASVVMVGVTSRAIPITAAGKVGLFGLRYSLLRGAWELIATGVEA